MAKRFLMLCLALSLGTLAACNINANRAVDAGIDGFKAATVSEAELISEVKAMRAYEDRVNKVATKDNAYAKRLAKITKGLHTEDGLNLDFKIYIVRDINANAAADGSVRVFTGLMDILTDDELFFVIGHEIGHVKNGDSMDQFRMIYVNSAARKAVGATSGVAAALTDSQLGDLAEQLGNAQFSQSQESEADVYGLGLMKKYKKNTKAAETALLKLAKLGGKSSAVNQMFSSHPDGEKRAAKIASMR